MPRLMPRRAALAVLLALIAACAPPAPQQGFRDPQTNIASIVLFDPGRFAGTWHVVADFPGADRATACGPTREDWRAVGPGRFAVQGVACTPRGRVPFSGAAAMTGPGRMTVSAGARPDLAGEPLWVLWVDADYRVAALGTPSGRFGMILSRSPQGRGDLVAAAREVLDFNGYALDRLRPR